jgi:hypothetical protein
MASSARPTYGASQLSENRRFDVTARVVIWAGVVDLIRHVSTTEPGHPYESRNLGTSVLNNRHLEP